MVGETPGDVPTSPYRSGWTGLAGAQLPAELVGLADDPALTTAAGAPLDPGSAVDAVGLRHGDVVVALDAEAVAPPADGPDRTGVRPPSGIASARPAATLVLASLLRARGRRDATRSPAAPGAVGGARVVLLALLLSRGGVRGTPRRRSARARTAASPAFAASAGFLAAYAHAPGGLLLGLAVSALAAAVFAAVARTFLDADPRTRRWRGVAGWSAPRSRC